MRYIKIPSDATFKTRPNPKKDGEETATYPTYSFADLLRENVNGDLRWFSDSEWENAFDDICTAFENAKPGDIIGLSDKAHEKLESIIRGIPFASDIKPSLRFFVRAITQADKLDPRPSAN